MMDAPHRRYNPLTDEWVLVSPHRTQRPWQGQHEETEPERPPYDPKCYLCPGNERAGGLRNPEYESTFVFTNDFAALLPEPKGESTTGLFLQEPIAGTCRVICYSPRHDLTLADLDLRQKEAVIQVWQTETATLGERNDWVQVFENKGAAMGCSNPHPHGQVWALDAVPSLPERERQAQSAYFGRHGRDLLGVVIAEELQANTRLVAQNDEWLAWVPFWAVWPFETILAPLRPTARLTDLTPGQSEGLAQILGQLLPAYDRLFGVSMPYSMGWHGAPFRTESPGWRLHAHFYPPLLRSATVRKFMVGFEMLAEPQRDITPESAAERLRSLSSPKS